MVEEGKKTTGGCDVLCPGCGCHWNATSEDLTRSMEYANFMLCRICRMTTCEKEIAIKYFERLVEAAKLDDNWGGIDRILNEIDAARAEAEKADK